MPCCKKNFLLGDNNDLNWTVQKGTWGSYRCRNIKYKWGTKRRKWTFYCIKLPFYLKSFSSFCRTVVPVVVGVDVVVLVVQQSTAGGATDCMLNTELFCWFCIRLNTFQKMQRMIFDSKICSVWINSKCFCCSVDLLFISVFVKFNKQSANRLMENILVGTFKNTAAVCVWGAAEYQIQAVCEKEK